MSVTENANEKGCLPKARKTKPAPVEQGFADSGFFLCNNLGGENRRLGAFQGCLMAAGAKLPRETALTLPGVKDRVEDRL